MAAMYELDDSFVAHDADVVTTLQQMVDSIEGMPEEHSSVDVKLCLSFSILKKNPAVPQLEHSVRFTFPPLYPDEASAARVEWEHGTRADHEYLNGVLAQFSSSLAGEESSMQLLEKAEELLNEVWAEKQMLVNAAEALKQDEAEDLLLHNDGVLGRRLIYFHHIIANGKRQAISEWAVQLRLGGYAKIGWPGIIIIEGPEACCQEYVRCLQRLRWQQMVVRGEQVEECPPGVGVDGLRRLHHGFEELDTNGMSELAERCRQAGLESLFLTSMKIYRDDDAGDKADGSGGPGAGGAGGGGSVEIGRRNKSKGNKR
eukprot:GHVU01035523.1.p1 GENE.GHVU01035523.1~~GHVU01035523.1.p1  ORF type:complete len:330 (+),score=74.26 GHVU01035523.1:48-992(+)